MYVCVDCFQNSQFFFYVVCVCVGVCVSRNLRRVSLVFDQLYVCVCVSKSRHVLSSFKSCACFVLPGKDVPFLFNEPHTGCWQSAPLFDTPRPGAAAQLAAPGVVKRCVFFGWFPGGRETETGDLSQNDGFSRPAE